MLFGQLETRYWCSKTCGDHQFCQRNGGNYMWDYVQSRLSSLHLPSTGTHLSWCSRRHKKPSHHVDIEIWIDTEGFRWCVERTMASTFAESRLLGLNSYQSPAYHGSKVRHKSIRVWSINATCRKSIERDVCRGDVAQESLIRIRHSKRWWTCHGSRHYG